MAAPEKTYNQITLDDGLDQDIQWIAPVIGGVTAASNLNRSDLTTNGGWEFEWPPTDGILIGARKPLPAARDLSGSQFIWLTGFTNQFGTALKFADLADGGLRFYITDSAGAYKGWTIYGRDISGENGNPVYGFGRFLNFINSLSQMWWCIDLDRTPDYSSGTLDLTDIVAIEVHVQNNASIDNTNTGRFACGYLLASDKAIIRAGEVANPASFAILPGTFANWNTTNNPLYPGGARTQGLTPISDGANGNVFQPICPVQIGDGSTATYFRQSRGQMAMQPSMEAIKYRLAQGETPQLLPVYLANDAEDCTHTINQSASDDVEIADFVWSAYDHPAKGYALEVTGSTSGTCALVRNSFFRAQFVRLGHATATDCIFDGCGAVEITADTGMTGAIIRNAPAGASALVISGGPGNYGAVEVRLNNPAATYDIEVGAGGAGTYDLSGVTVPSGYTVRLYNPTAAAITVALAAGISSSTAGGAITIEQPKPTQSVTVSNGIAGTLLLIQDVTDPAAPINLYLGTPSIWPHVWQDPEAYVADRDIRLRAMYQSGTVATLFIDEAIGASTQAAPALAYRLNQRYDEVYSTNGIDGSTVSGVAITDDTLLLQISVGAMTWGQIYAYETYWLATEAGIVDEGRIIIAPDPANYLFDGDWRLKNVTSPSAPLTISGGFGRSVGTGTTASMIDTTGGTIFATPDQVIAFATGSGVTSQDKVDIIDGIETRLSPELAKVNNLPADPASQSELLAALLPAIEDAALL
mgnify:CR=1 FL=1|jgi:hypothetical protein